MTQLLVQVVAISLLVLKENIRDTYDPEHLNRLAISIKAKGILNPPRVRQVADHFVVVTGHCRVLAATQAGWTEIPVVVIDRDPTEAELLAERLIENEVREDLSYCEFGRGLRRLMDMEGRTVSELTEEFGFKLSRASKALKLLSLPPSIQQLVDERRLAPTAAYQLTFEPDPVRQLELAEQLVNGQLDRDGITRRVRRPKDKVQGATVRRVTCKLNSGASLSLSDESLTLDRFIEVLQEVLQQARKARSSGLEIGTLAKIFKDKARGT